MSSTTDAPGTAATTSGALTEEEIETLGQILHETIRAQILRDFPANRTGPGPLTWDHITEEQRDRTRERAATVVAAYIAAHRPAAAAGEAGEGAVVDVMAALSRWLHPDLDDWPTWRIDEMIGEIIDAATTDHPAHHPTATGDAGEREIVEVARAWFQGDIGGHAPYLQERRRATLMGLLRDDARDRNGLADHRATANQD